MDSKFGYPDTGGDLITKDNPQVVRFFSSLDELVKGVEVIGVPNLARAKS